MAESAKPFTSVGVLGAGAWGTALAQTLCLGGAHVIIAAREADVAESINTAHENRRFLPGIRLAEGLSATSDVRALFACEAIWAVPPAQYTRNVLRELKGLKPGTPVIVCAKGIEQNSAALLNEVLAEELPEAAPAMLSGPSFAKDVAKGMPTAVTLAASSAMGQRLQATMARAPGFRPYLTDDLIGVALGGAAKNVYAIACGMVEGAGLGESARAALLARSFAELCRLGVALGARMETFMGLSGLGDLVLTATSMTSRNFALGSQLGKGKTLKELSGEGKPLAEGAATAPALVQRGLREKVELPVASAVADVLAGKLDVKRAAERLMARPVGQE